MDIDRRRTIAATILLALLGVGVPLAATAADTWAELSRPGTIVLFRHASAPGIGDPPQFRMGDCATQRNLSEQGRAEARRLGELFRARQVDVGAVLTSQWCRTRETARLAFGDRPRDEPAFNSFFQQSASQREAQTAKAREILAAWKGPGVLVVVTHQVNITALTGRGAASAEGTVVRVAPDGAVQVLGTIEP